MPAYNPAYFMETSANILENDALRAPQIDAYVHLYNHFVTDKKTTHAIIVMPTGVGKTGVIGIAPYNVCQGRVLVITPQLTIKDTVIDSFDTATENNFWYERKVITNIGRLPTVIEYEGEETTDEVLGLSNFVILNIHKLQGRLRSSLLGRVSKDYFDMIIVDEAHHSTANTWIEALEYFDNAKVIKITGTPIRSDGEKMSGELAFEYKLSQAMANNYVKSLVNIEFIPSEIKFTVDKKDDRTYTESEILDIKDEEWVSRSVALSPECSMQIIEKSKEYLKAKRTSGIHHMIIAVACSISHATDIAQMYKKTGLTTEVIHSGLEKEEIDKIKSDIKNNRIDVIVNVGMLGEGYDHKYLSIAAIFRPYRNQLPYAQFIGRILRYIPEGKVAEDNIGRIVSHKLLSLNDLWNQYKIEIQESEIIRNLIDHNELKEYAEYEDAEAHRYIDFGDVHTTGGVVVEDPYLETEMLKRHREEQEERQKKIRKITEALGVSVEKAEQIISENIPDIRYNRPDLLYKAKRRDIDVRIKEEVVPKICVKYIEPNSATAKFSECALFAKEYKWIALKHSNDAARLAVYLTIYLKDKIGKNRKDWTLDECDRANDLLDKHIEYIEGMLQSFYRL